MSAKRQLRPTGTCFDDALETLQTLAKAAKTYAELQRWTLVHGICSATPADGLVAEPYAHAWLEYLPAREPPFVLQSGILEGRRLHFEMLRSDFWEGYKPIRETRYTYEQAVAENHRTGHYGPWRSAYRQRLAQALDLEAGEAPLPLSSVSVRKPGKHDT